MLVGEGHPITDAELWEVHRQGDMSGKEDYIVDEMELTRETEMVSSIMHKIHVHKCYKE